MSTLLSVRKLVTSFRTDEGVVRAVDGVSFDIPRRGVLGLTGESGCGKTVTALSVMRLVAAPGEIESGEVLYDGRDLLQLSEREMLPIRGRKMAMIFQEPMASLNPVYTIGNQIAEVVRVHQKLARDDARQKAIEILRLVGTASAEARFDFYPHQLSGGMRQRVAIAMALACEPELLIVDEPTASLDVTSQAHIFDVLRKLRDQRDMSVLLVTHDLGVLAEFAEQLLVMHAGRVVERGPVREILSRPKHPYTEALLRSIPPLDRSRPLRGAERPSRLATVAGMMPELSKVPMGCTFRERCSYVEARCHETEPELLEVEPTAAEKRQSRCFFFERVGSA
ncbi:MAG TPA: ABC transporter ATP-binding protein [Polyangiaceae bacterium]